MNTCTKNIGQRTICLPFTVFPVKKITGVFEAKNDYDYDYEYDYKCLCV